jgi:hypothetical protein
MCFCTSQSRWHDSCYYSLQLRYFRCGSSRIRYGVVCSPNIIVSSPLLAIPDLETSLRGGFTVVLRVRVCSRKCIRTPCRKTAAELVFRNVGKHSGQCFGPMAIGRSDETKKLGVFSGNLPFLRRKIRYALSAKPFHPSIDAQ